MNAAMATLILFITILFDLVVFLFLTRILLVWHNVHYFNPICQFIGKLTNPLVNPLTKFIPRIGKLETASLLIVLLLQIIKAMIIYGLNTGMLLLSPVVLGYALFKTAGQLASLLFYVVLIIILFSWINPGMRTPLTEVLSAIAEPLLRPFRRLIPPIAGFDISPIPVLIGLQLLVYFFYSLSG